jgi:hypothetical protein
MLIKCLREKFMVKDREHLRIGDVSKDEALRYLELRNVDDKLAAQI